MRDKLTRGRALQLLLALSVLTGATAYHTLHAEEPMHVAQSSQPAVAGCDLSLQDCDLPLGVQKVHIQLDNRPVRSDTPTSVTLTTSEPGWEPLEAEIQGQSMYMGRLPLLLTRGVDNRWQGTIQVPACTHDVMVWQLDINWQSKTQQAHTSQLFSVRRD